MKLALRAVAAFYGHLTARHSNVFFPPAGLLKSRSGGVDFIAISGRILIPFSHKSVRRSPVTVCHRSA